MRRPRVLVLKVAALQVGRREVPQVVQPAEPQVVQPGEAQRVAPLAVPPVPVRLEPRVLLERRVPQARWLVRSPGLLALSAWLVQ